MIAPARHSERSEESLYFRGERSDPIIVRRYCCYFERNSQMHYWRQQDFKTLKNTAAAAVNASPHWQAYADFCLEYERWFRNQAFLILERFIGRIEREPFLERRRFVSWLMNIAEGQDGRHMLIPHPLKVRVVEPTLLEWVEVEPLSSEPHRWIGDLEHLERAVELDPTDHIALKKLIIVLLSRVGYATHELPYGYLGSVSEDLATLSKIEALLPRLPNEDDRAAYAVDVAEERYSIHKYLRKQS
ncbi:MAG TPA: hypothetical protein VIX90_11075 [Edaphobacter sp.]